MTICLYVSPFNCVHKYPPNIGSSSLIQHTLHTPEQSITSINLGSWDAMEGKSALWESFAALKWLESKSRCRIWLVLEPVDPLKFGYSVVRETAAWDMEMSGRLAPRIVSAGKGYVEACFCYWNRTVQRWKQVITKTKMENTMLAEQSLGRMSGLWNILPGLSYSGCYPSRVVWEHIRQGGWA